MIKTTLKILIFIIQLFYAYDDVIFTHAALKLTFMNEQHIMNIFLYILANSEY